MLVVEDFTRFLEGSDLPLEGHVARCPRCGRTGIEQCPPSGGATYVHVQASEVLGDGMWTEPQDCCSVPAA